MENSATNNEDKIARVSNSVVHTNHDLHQVAAIFVSKLLALRPDERLLVYTDRGTDERVSGAVINAATKVGAAVETYEINSSFNLELVAQQLTDRLTHSKYDVVCELSEQYFYQTTAWSTGQNLGTRFYSLQGLDANAFVRCFAEVDFTLMDQFGSSLVAVLKGGKNIRITTDNGTDIRCNLTTGLSQKILNKIMSRQNSYVYSAPSELSAKGQSRFMGGQLAFLGVPESTNGVAVIDSYIWPPSEIRHFSDEPILLDIEAGFVRKIRGCPRKSAILKNWFGSAPLPIKHFCMGFHPTATLFGNLMEAERTIGCLNIGFGDYPLHVDGVMVKPTITVDNVPLEKRGKFIHPTLSPIADSLVSGFQPVMI